MEATINAMPRDEQLPARELHNAWGLKAKDWYIDLVSTWTNFDGIDKLLYEWCEFENDGVRCSWFKTNECQVLFQIFLRQ